MSLERVQELAEALGARLGRSVVVDDHSLQLLAAGPDYGDADAARVWSLLHRRTRPEDVDYPRLRRASGPVVVEAVADLELARRCCVPIRHEGELLGFLWLIDADATLVDDEIADAVATADAMGRALSERVAARDREAALVEHLLGALLGSDADERRVAAADLVAHGFVRDDEHVGVLVCGPVRPPGDATGLRRSIERAMRQVPPLTALAAVRGATATDVVSSSSPIEALLRRVADELTGDERGRWCVGISESSHGLGAAAHAHDQAIVALRVASSLPGEGRCRHFGELGAAALLAQFPGGILEQDLVPAGIVRLLRSPPKQGLLETLEAFLDAAGDRQRSAEQLGIHRTTLYYRLEKIEGITGCSMANGDDRLLLHLATKLYRLAGGLDGVAARAGDARHGVGRDCAPAVGESGRTADAFGEIEAR